MHAGKQRATLGRGKYSASQSEDKVVVFAEGEAPTPNYKVWLQYGPERIFPPILELWWLAPTGMQLQVMTPFRVHASFTAPMKLEEITVRDAEGSHKIKVEQIATEPPPVEEPHRALANFFQLKDEGGAITFTQANIAGQPLLSVGDRHFYGDQIKIESTKLGDVVSVVTSAVIDGDSTSLSLVLPPTLVEGHEPVDVEVLVIESTHRSTIAGPPLGQGIVYKPRLAKGAASFMIS
ncbi:MAG: hypothetical protein KC636_34510 [Myxococcales bacterium]|nr:hypothetical protein [Myxococcales bacterium]